MVSVANEERVKVAVTCVKGRAEYWWRGTGSWMEFIYFVLDHFLGLWERFNEMSTYEIIGQFHDLKQCAMLHAIKSGMQSKLVC